MNIVKTISHFVLVSLVLLLVSAANADPMQVGGQFPKSVLNLDNKNLPVYDVQALNQLNSPYSYVAIAEQNCPDAKQNCVSLWRLDTTNGDSNAIVDHVGAESGIVTQVYQMSLALGSSSSGSPIDLAYVDQNDNKKLKVVKNSCSATDTDVSKCTWQGVDQDGLDSLLGVNHQEENLSLKISKTGNLFLAFEERQFNNAGLHDIGLLEYDVKNAKWIELIKPTDNFAGNNGKIYLQLIGNIEVPWVAYTHNDNNVFVARRSSSDPSQWESTQQFDDFPSANAGMDFIQCQDEQACVVCSNVNGKSGWLTLEITQNASAQHIIWKNNHTSIIHARYPSMVNIDSTSLPVVSAVVYILDDISGYVTQMTSTSTPLKKFASNLSQYTATVSHYVDGTLTPLTFAADDSGHYGFYKNSN